MDSITSAVISLAERHLGEFKIRNNQIVTRFCPFCNGGEHNDKDTFAVGLHNGAFSCMRGGCNKTGSFKELSEFFGEATTNVYITPKTVGSKKKTYNKPDPNMLRGLNEDVVTYFALRKISEKTLKDFGVSTNDHGNIVFPFYRDGELVYVKYRKPKKHTKEDGPKEWQDSNTEPILYGMDLVSKNKPLIIAKVKSMHSVFMRPAYPT